MKTLIDRKDKNVLMQAGYQVKNELEAKGKFPMFLAVSGSHSCGLERPDSDIDIRGVYLDQTTKVLSLHPGRDTVEGELGTIDYQCYELGKFFGMLEKGNGNTVRLLLGPYILYSIPTVDWLKLGRIHLTKVLRSYYKGYAQAQRKRAMSDRGGKALIYTYREIFEGITLMVTGDLKPDFLETWGWCRYNGFYPQDALLNRYFGEPKKEVTDGDWLEFYSEWDKLCGHLEEETAKSKLPDGPNSFELLNSILIEWRLKGLFLPDASPTTVFLPKPKVRQTNLDIAETGPHPDFILGGGNPRVGKPEIEEEE